MAFTHTIVAHFPSHNVIHAIDTVLIPKYMSEKIASSRVRSINLIY